ncbi:hypothetical protein ON064_04195 [Planococcus sp. A6]|uniref:hypothetical protein n=1 Tax=Planococcus sp. A6 TaxID=2992760 RepID=UPI00237BA9F7|nr:hypothetical protein [Planococcus sp. A6]MDE0582247.1 hypothetical protein [Planococcus sp. A6]
MGAPIQLYVDVNEAGEVKSVYAGKDIVATEQYDYFFIADEETANNAGLYKVVIEKMKPKLVLKEAPNE